MNDEKENTQVEIVPLTRILRIFCRNMVINFISSVDKTIVYLLQTAFAVSAFTLLALLIKFLGGLL